MDCQKCNYNNDADSKFCISCGGSLIKSAEEREKVENILFIPTRQSDSILRVALIGIILVGGLFIFAYWPTDTNTSTVSPVADEIAETDDSLSTDNSWESFTSTEYGFRVDFPTYPSTERIPEETTEGITISGTQYIASDSDENAYLAQGVEYYGSAPEDFDNKTGLEAALNGFLETGTYTVINSFFTVYSGYEALQFELHDDENASGIEGIVFIRDDLENVRLYLLIVGSEIETTDIFNRFINSFEITR